MITYVHVNLSALRHNVGQVKSMLAPASRLLAVVKANAYGHGLAPAAHAFIEAGAAWLGVSTVAEGVALREAGLNAPLLAFLPPTPEECDDLVRHRLTGTLVRVSQVHEIAAACERTGQSAYYHIYMDTGLGRLGSDDSLPDLLEAASAIPRLHVTGVYTHFGPPGSGRMLGEIDFLRKGASVKAFAALAREAAAIVRGEKLMVHAAASSLFLEGAANHLDMVRVGTLLYGQYPDHVQERPLALREDTFELRSRIVAVHTLPVGSKVGYGGEFICRRESRIATIPVGTAHGLEMVPGSISKRPRSALKGYLAGREGRRGKTTYAPAARIGEQRIPLVGRVSMDQCCLDVTDVGEAGLYTEVTLPARRLSVSPALPRVYVED